MTVNINEINYDKPLRGLVDTHVLRTALHALEVTALHLARHLGSSFKNLTKALKIAKKTAALSKQVRAAEIYNLNLRRRDWVLSSIERRLWLRGLIGEARINRWMRRRDGAAPVSVSVSVANALKQQVRAPFPRAARPCRKYNWYTLARHKKIARPAQLAKLAQLAQLAAIAKIKRPSFAAMPRVEFYPHELTNEYVYDGNPVINKTPVPGPRAGALRATLSLKNNQWTPAQRPGAETGNVDDNPPTRKPPIHKPP